MQNILIFLNGERGISVLSRLHNSTHNVDHVLAPRAKCSNGAVPELCESLGVPLELVDSVNDPPLLEFLKSLRPQLFIVAGYSEIFRGITLAVPELGVINLHAGRLPQYRGGSPLNWQIINGEEVAGCSVVWMDERIDAGPVIAEAEIPIDPDDTIASLHERANHSFAELTIEAVDRIDAGNAQGRKQDPALAGYWHQRNDGDGCISWRSQTAVEVHNFVRALTRPYPGAFTYFGDRKVRIYGSSLVDHDIKGTQGRVCHIEGAGPYVICADRAILLTEYKIEDAVMSRLPSGCHLG